jgi:hypothetical protein
MLRESGLSKGNSDVFGRLATSLPREGENSRLTGWQVGRADVSPVSRHVATHRNLVQPGETRNIRYKPAKGEPRSNYPNEPNRVALRGMGHGGDLVLIGRPIIVRTASKCRGSYGGMR